MAELERDVKEDLGKEAHDNASIGQTPGSAQPFDASFKSKWEELDRVRTLKVFWKMTLVCFAVAFSAAADGYQVSQIVLSVSAWR